MVEYLCNQADREYETPIGIGTTKETYDLLKTGLNERQIKAVMYVKEKRKITNREYQNINNCSRNTATNDLRVLVKKHILKESGKKGAGAYYIIA